jgi:hypothetical protein
MLLAWWSSNVLHHEIRYATLGMKPRAFCRAVEAYVTAMALPSRMAK